MHKVVGMFKPPFCPVHAVSVILCPIHYFLIELHCNFLKLENINLGSAGTYDSFCFCFQEDPCILCNKGFELPLLMLYCHRVLNMVPYVSDEKIL